MDDTALQDRGFYITAFLDDLRASLARKGPRVLEVKVEPSGLSERDAALLV